MLTPLSRDSAQRFREYLTGAGFTMQGLLALLQSAELPSQRLGNLPRLLYRTAEPTPLNTLARLFSLAVPVPVEAARMLPDWFLPGCLEAGLTIVEGGEIVPKASLAPFEGFLLASDTVKKIDARNDPEVVSALNPTTWFTYRFTVRRPYRAVLDLGAGAGPQALAAAQHSDVVVATDLNPRCTEFAVFNARLNGFDNIECLTGDRFAPVAGRMFDLIVSNPPFFITPGMDYLFCQNPLDLDGFSRLVAIEGAAHLNDGGFLQMTCEWVQVEGEPWQERLAGWLRGVGCDALILQSYRREPVIYADAKIRELTSGTPSAIDTQLSQWMEYYKVRKVEAILGGIIVLRKRTGANWLRMGEMPPSVPVEPYGDSIQRLFDTQDLLAANRRDEQFLRLKVAVSPDLVLEQRFTPSAGGWQPSATGLRLIRGLSYVQEVAPPVAGFLARLDGRRSLGEVAGGLAKETGAPPEQVLRECAGIVRHLLERGFLVCEGGAEIT